MRKYLFLSSAAICLLGIPSLAAAAHSMGNDSMTIANSRQEVAVRFAEANSRNPSQSQQGFLKENSKSPCTGNNPGQSNNFNRGNSVVSPANNGFGNCDDNGNLQPPGNSRIPNQDVR